MKTRMALCGLAILAIPSIAAVWDEDESTFTIASLYHAGELDKAEQAVQEYLARDGHPFPEVWLMAGRIFLAQGHAEKAAAILTVGIGRCPQDDYRLWSLLGEARLRLGNEAMAVVALHKSLRLNAKYGPTYLWLAKASYGNPLQVVWLKEVLVFEDKDSPTAAEALAMLTKLAKEPKAQQPAGAAPAKPEPAQP